MAFAAFYDANVLIPHEIRDVLMISASTRLHAVYWSEDIFAEWLRNSVENNLAPEATVLRFQGIMNEMFPDAMIARARYERLIDSMTNQSGDRHVLAAAVIAEADVLVTHNTDDFPKESVDVDVRESVPAVIAKMKGRQPVHGILPEEGLRNGKRVIAADNSSRTWL